MLVGDNETVTADDKARSQAFIPPHPGFAEKLIKKGGKSGAGRTSLRRPRVEILTTLGVTVLETAVKARWAARISAGTSLTGASASPVGRFELNSSGSSLDEEEQPANSTRTAVPASIERRNNEKWFIMLTFRPKY